MNLDENELKQMKKVQAKNKIKEQINETAFKDLKTTQKEHSKVNKINYEKLELQPYLKTGLLSNKEAEILTALRSRSLRNFEDNFHTFYMQDQQCPLCKRNQDTQEHCMNCPDILNRIPPVSNHIKYEHIY